MIRILAITILSTLCTTTAVFSQINDYGVKLGTQSAGVYSEPSADSRVLGFSAYGFIDFQLSDRFFSTIDLGITQRGFKNAQNETNEVGQVIQRVEATSRLSYLSLNSLLNVEVFGNSQKLFFGIGPRFDLLVSRSPGEYEFTNITVREEIIDDFNEFAFGSTITAGIKNISVQELNLRLEAKYEVDITDSFSDHPREFRNNVIMFVIGIGF